MATDAGMGWMGVGCGCCSKCLCRTVSFPTTQDGGGREARSHVPQCASLGCACPGWTSFASSCHANTPRLAVWGRIVVSRATTPSMAYIVCIASSLPVPPPFCVSGWGWRPCVLMWVGGEGGGCSTSPPPFCQQGTPTPIVSCLGFLLFPVHVAALLLLHLCLAQQYLRTSPDTGPRHSARGGGRGQGRRQPTCVCGWIVHVPTTPTHYQTHSPTTIHHQQPNPLF